MKKKKKLNRIDIQQSLVFYMGKEKYIILREEKYCKTQVLPCWQVRVFLIPRNI